jgi:two-component system response regulator FlrC
MRLLIVGKLEGYIAEAGRIAVGKGAKVSHIDDVDGALGALRAGKGGDLLMIDIKCDVEKLITALKAERFTLPVVACGIGNDPAAAVKAIKAGAREFMPLAARCRVDRRGAGRCRRRNHQLRSAAIRPCRVC